MNKRTALLLLVAITCLAASEARAYTVLPARHLFDVTANFLQPTDVAVGRQGRVYVMDGVNSRVVVFDADGRFLSSFGRQGSQPGAFSRPVGIATGSDGLVYVSDTGNRRIQVFSPDGTFQRQIVLPPPKDGLPRDPVDVAVDEGQKHLFVTDNDHHQVLVFSNPDGRLLATWGSKGPRFRQFHYPFFIAVGNGSSVYIVDVLNTRVQVWRDGDAAGIIGGWGVEPGQFYRPKGICVDTTGQIFVSDSVLGVIQVFSRDGDFSAVLGTESGQVLKLKTPVGIAVDGSRRLYVVEMLLNRVRAYDVSVDQKVNNRTHSVRLEKALKGHFLSGTPVPLW